MFLKTKKASSAPENTGALAVTKKGTPTLVSHGANILGNIASDGVVDIDGTVEGNVKSDQVTVRANGRIQGDVVANVVHVYGEISGMIRSHAVHLYSSAHVTGVIVHQSLTVEDGAFLDAKFKRMNDTSDSGNTSTPSFTDGDEGLIESAPSFIGNSSLRLIG